MVCRRRREKEGGGRRRKEEITDSPAYGVVPAGLMDQKTLSGFERRCTDSLMVCRRREKEKEEESQTGFFYCGLAVI
jgi:hypothetical protein